MLVNNAGAGYTMPLLDADLDEARRLYETNVWGTMRTVLEFSALLIESRGRVVNMSAWEGYFIRHGSVGNSIIFFFSRSFY